MAAERRLLRTLPKEVLLATEPRVSPPGSIHLITRRVLLRLLLLLPTRDLVQSFLYILGYLQSKFDVEYHNLCCLSNHLHLIMTDTLGDQLQAFIRELFSLTGRSSNCFLGREENFWSAEKASCVMLAPLLETLVDKGVYVNANPVSAGLVSNSKKWEGCQVRPSELGQRVIRVQRPKFFFDPLGGMPKEVEVRFTVPKAFDAAEEEVKQRMCQELNRVEQEIRDEFKKEGRSFLGMKRVKRRSRTSAAQSIEERGKLSPTVACKDPSLRAKFLKWKSERRHKYDEARARLLEGRTDVCFPEGSYVVHVQYGHPREDWLGCIWRRLMSDP